MQEIETKERRGKENLHLTSTADIYYTPLPVSEDRQDTEFYLLTP